MTTSTDLRVWRRHDRTPYEMTYRDAPAYMPHLEAMAWAIGYNEAFRRLVVAPTIAVLTGGAT